MANTTAVTGLVTFEDAKAWIGVLPILVPRPNATNIRALTVIQSMRHIWRTPFSEDWTLFGKVRI